MYQQDFKRPKLSSNHHFFYRSEVPCVAMDIDSSSTSSTSSCSIIAGPFLTQQARRYETQAPLSILSSSEAAALKNDVVAYRNRLAQRQSRASVPLPRSGSMLQRVKLTVTELLRWRKFNEKDKARQEEAVPDFEEYLRRAREDYRKRPQWRFVELSASESEKVDEMMASIDEAPHALVVTVDGVEITRKELLCLRPVEWLNDEVINVYMGLLNQRSDRRNKAPKCYHWNTFFYSQLTSESSFGDRQYDYNRVRRWTTRKKIDLFSKDLILLPLHVNKVHWALGCVDMQSKLVFFFDSLGGEAEPAYFETLMRYLDDEHRDKKGGPLPDKDKWLFAGNNFSLSKFLPVEVFDEITQQAGATRSIDLPQQTNGSDCGVFACQYAESLSQLRFPFDFDSADIPVRRKKMVFDIMRKFVDE